MASRSLLRLWDGGLPRSCFFYGRVSPGVVFSLEMLRIRLFSLFRQCLERGFVTGGHGRAEEIFIPVLFAAHGLSRVALSHVLWGRLRYEQCRFRDASQGRPEY